MLNTIDINLIKNIASDAGKAIMDIYVKNFAISYKMDNSPLTEADILANEIICNQLQYYYPSIPILSEENKEIPYVERKDWEYYWCIDPIDGTKEFIKKNGEFTVNIALIHKNRPILGVVLSPTTKDIFYAKKGFGAFQNNTKLPIDLNKKEFVIVASKSHLTNTTTEYIDSIKTSKFKKLISIGSSLKLCLVASGLADIYPRFAPTKEWDTAAAHAILLESGKNIFQANSNDELEYNKKNLTNPSFIAK